VGLKKNLGGIEKRSSRVFRDDKKSHKSGPRLKATHIPMMVITIDRVTFDPFASIKFYLIDGGIKPNPDKPEMNNED